MSALAVHGQETDCDKLPPDQRPGCWMVMACAAIDDDERRAECFRAASQRFDQSGEDQSPVVTAAPESTPPDRLVELRPGVGEPAVPSQSVLAPNKPDTGVETPSVASPPPARAGQSDVPRSVTERTVTQAALSVPNRFSAKVTAVHALTRDRQLVALDNKLVFEGGQASIARIEVGDTVDVVRASAFIGRRFRMTGPSHRPFTGTRIRCERLDLSDGNRRKCDAVLDLKSP